VEEGRPCAWYPCGEGARRVGLFGVYGVGLSVGKNVDLRVDVKVVEVVMVVLVAFNMKNLGPDWECL